MKTNFLFGAVVVLFLCLTASPAFSQGAPSADEVQKLMDSARTAQVPIFAPKAFDKAKGEYDQGQIEIKLKRDGTKYLAKAREYTENAFRATDVCKLSLKEYLPPREKARAARAHLLVPEVYGKAEEQFLSATGKVESGDVKGGLREAAKSSPLFDTAELEAIRFDMLGKADTLIAAAVVDEAPKYALTTLDKARTARAKANSILTADRYNRKEAAVEVARAEYEARHASNIAQSVRSLNRNDQAWEKLMLLYEIQMNRVGEVLKLPYLPFDNGPLAAADTLIAAVKKESAGSAATVAGSNDSIAHLLRVIDEFQGEQDKLAEQLGIMTDAQGGAANRQAQAEQIRTTVAAMATEKGKLSAQMAEEQSKLSQLSEEHKEVAAQLQVRQDREAKLSQAKTIIDPTQGEIFVNPSNDIVLRLFTLSFAAGKSEITDQHLALLDKVKQIIALFPESKLVVEGHTDDRGDATANTQLSEKRAFAVMQYLRQAMSIPSDRIRAIGYGSEKPIAPQSTSEGRAKNRRIDILIMQ